MLSKDDETEIQNLNKKIRILENKLHRSETERAKLEGTNRNREYLLKKVICELQESQEFLEKKRADLEKVIDELKRVQDRLIESEKMAALGTLVAGVAHEINTPLGTSITLASALRDETQLFYSVATSGQLKRSLLNSYIEVAAESTDLILNNLQRAGELVQSFKQVAVDQSTLEQRTFQVKSYLEEVTTSLSPHLKSTLHTLSVTGDDYLAINSYPGALAQLVTNLVTNSLTHAYQAGMRGCLYFEVMQRHESCLIHYSDDGCGIPQAILGKIFEPFFTTARDRGGTGLGLHISYNLVTQKLQGTIDVKSEVGQGTQFIITLPLSVAN
ncbi:sensor histidine kinase [Merismopedia glauca]|uniref:histidine kinase n=1 Tax=Merismopedia glauca CCAP 1448/3 TaxID=1296344 RepID=A0A2T1BXI3_9CYAN|nr:HAMP domain-containing sensor histidine kinase [Merismopedia glauca]PSB00633.1 two-component sensor histidine kinase [Merismopedia glauca CCAP 1448/3]